MTESIIAGPPPGFSPITPLGHAEGVFYIITGAGELRGVSGQNLEAGRGVDELFFGGVLPDGEPLVDWLVAHFPPARARGGPDAYDRTAAGRWILQHCAALGLFNAATPARKTGVWRSRHEDGRVAALAHCGDRLISSDGEVSRAGFRRGREIYPACPPDFEASPIDQDGWRDAPLSSVEATDFARRFRTMWSWARPDDADVILGWIGMAALGGFPKWRAHLWVSGKQGSGKTHLSRTVRALLGPAASDPLTDFTAAGVRQRMQGQARPILFDEAENKGGGEVSKLRQVIELFRSMSCDGGGNAVRGSSSHEARSFLTLGAGGLFSINPGSLEPQDRSRFVLLKLKELRKCGDRIAAAERLDSFHAETAAMGPRLWRRMIEKAPLWDERARRYSALVQCAGGEARDGDTIGAILAGWDLLMFDGPSDDERLQEALMIAKPLIEDAQETAEDGEGESCWAHLMSSAVTISSGRYISIAELIAGQRAGGEYKDVLGRFGLRLTTGDAPKLYLVSGRHRELSRIFANTRWEGGGHKSALELMAGVEALKNPQRVGGRKVRVLSIPKSQWPAWGGED